MNFLMMLASRGAQQVTETITANTTWVAPATTNRIDTASGKGAAGTPSKTIEQQYTLETVTRYKTAGGTDVLTFTHDGWDQYIEGCSMHADDGIYYQYQQCFTYKTRTVTTTATTGASTTAFGKSFPGGAGGPATTTTFSNLPITPGASYSIVVPSGGSLTITYMK